jgi:hypothetical protein
MNVTNEGIVIDDNPVQDLKALYPIEVIVEGRLIDVNALQ